ncbi:piggyBac transposable element-derived protein 1-like [Artemia franciscana]|uniref:piggyBac transposable element-derived protein 1-like n=1 Tax=Artemia franciscana TaxID=6661 RepID=UPI0032DBD4D9
MPFNGRSVMWQYLPNKPHKLGFKVFTRAGSSGIMYGIEIYQGRGTAEAGPFGLGGDVVMRLLRSLKPKAGHRIFFDKWFSSVDLVVHLKKIGYDCVWTIRQNRLSGCELMEEKELKRFGRGHVDWRVKKSTEVCLVRWYDNKAVTHLSSYVAVEPKDTIRSWDSSEKKYVGIERPAVIKQYNKYMGGVDLADMLIELYHSNLKTRKWYMCILYYVFDSAVINALLIYRRH